MVPNVQNADGLASPTSRILPETQVSPAIISALIRRVRALLIRIVDHEVDEDKITSSEGLINPAVVAAFYEIGGDFTDAVPYCLLEARKWFLKDASHHPLDYTLNVQRALATEVIARRLVARIERLSNDQCHGQSHLCLTKKFRRIQSDGDISLPTSALEAAIDQHTTILLSSTEAQKVVDAIWMGHLVQKYGEDGYSYFEPYHAHEDGSFLAHFDPSRLAVPRYSYVFNIIFWILFLAVFTVQTRTYKEFDVFEALLWVMAAGYILEDASRWIKIGGIDAINFWTVLEVATNSLFTVSFCFRVASFAAQGKHAELYQLRAFQLLACVAPLVWIQLLKLFDGFVYFGTLQVIILRMFKETAIFFTLLALVMAGFFHAFYALDAADESRVDNAVVKIIDTLIQTLLGGANFDLTNDQAFSYPWGHILYYAYCFITAVILLNILVAFFGTAYSDVTVSARAVFFSFFSEKVISMVRAPDQFVYLAPFNLLEAFLIAPLEYVLTHEQYARLNYWIQSTVYSLPLFAIACFESRVVARRVGAIALQEPHTEQDEARGSGIGGTVEDPEIPNDELTPGLQISKKRFEDIVAMASIESAK
ncbi:Calcium channel yvc1 [Thecaphora frezii]